MASPIAKQYARLLTLWPKDALRPNQPFTRAIEYRAQAHGVKPVEPVEPVEPASPPPKKQPTPVKPCAPASPRNPQLEQAQVNALFSLLENRYSNKYTLSPQVFKPVSAPEHYTRLLEEIDRAPHKTWWQSKVDQWKMKIRWK